MDSSPSRAAGILVFGALATPIIVVVWLYWGTGWGLVAWAACLPLALVPWGFDATRRTIAGRSRKHRRAARGAVGSALRTTQAHRQALGGALSERSPAEPRRGARPGSAETG